MAREGRAYYVGLLKAAELHGATHQAVTEFQFVTAKRLPRIRAGRGLIVFYFRRDMEAVTAGIEHRKTDTGTMKISSAALPARRRRALRSPTFRVRDAQAKLQQQVDGRASMRRFSTRSGRPKYTGSASSRKSPAIGALNHTENRCRSQLRA